MTLFSKILGLVHKTGPPSPTEEAQKQCRRCRALKPTSEFGVDRGRADGRNLWCRSCVNDYALERYHKKRGTAPKARPKVKAEEKVCRCCLQSKPLSEFYRRREGADGFRGQCRACYIGRARDRILASHEPTGGSETAAAGVTEPTGAGGGKDICPLCNHGRLPESLESLQCTRVWNALDDISECNRLASDGRLPVLYRTMAYRLARMLGDKIRQEA